MYGTFLHWALCYFSGLTDLKSPHTNLSNSHLFRGPQAPHLLNIHGWREYIANPHRYYKIVRFHPRGPDPNDKIELVLDEVLQTANKAIVIYHTDDYLLLALNNKIEKIWAHGWLKERESEFVDKLSNWGKSKLSDMDRWELREFLSLYIYNQHIFESDYQDLVTYTNPKLYKLNIHDLINSFEITILDLLSYCKLPVVRNNFDNVYQEWAACQKHFNKDIIVKKIVDSVISKTYFDWPDKNLTLVDEAIVQMQLRDLHKLDLKCYNLNVFPTNTNDLQKLLINV